MGVCRWGKAVAAVKTRVGYCFHLSIDRFSIEDKTISDESWVGPRRRPPWVAARVGSAPGCTSRGRVFVVVAAAVWMGDDDVEMRNFRFRPPLYIAKIIVWYNNITIKTIYCTIIIIITYIIISPMTHSPSIIYYKSTEVESQPIEFQVWYKF